MLQHHPVVQPWSECIDLGPDYQIVGRHESFAWSHHCGRRKRAFGEGGYYYAGPLRGGSVNAWHPGFAVAMRREAFDVLGGFPAWAILGSGDNHLMWSLLGEAYRSVHPLSSPGYRKALRELEARAGDCGGMSAACGARSPTGGTGRSGTGATAIGGRSWSITSTAPSGT
jgi:hypothetical protein